MRLLLVEDEKRMAQALCEILRLENTRLTISITGLTVWRQSKAVFTILQFLTLCFPI